MVFGNVLTQGGFFWVSIIYLWGFFFFLFFYQVLQSTYYFSWISQYCRLCSQCNFHWWQMPLKFLLTWKSVWNQLVGVSLNYNRLCKKLHNTTMPRETNRNISWCKQELSLGGEIMDDFFFLFLLTVCCKWWMYTAFTIKKLQFGKSNCRE